jgi:hypothetical protein
MWTAAEFGAAAESRNHMGVPCVESDTEPKRVRPFTVGLFALLVLAMGGLGISRWNPLLAAGMNNQLETKCAADPALALRYDRSSWTPLRWSCTVSYPDGTTSILRSGIG